MEAISGEIRSQQLNDNFSELDSAIFEVNEKTNKGQTITVASNGKYKTIGAAVSAAKANGVSKTNRYTIEIAPGIYNEKLVLANGIDLIGTDNKNTIIQYSGTGLRADDTIMAPYDCSIRNLTIIQDASSNSSDLQNYPIHVDGNTAPYALKLENVIAIAKGEWAHHAIGLGLGANQSFEAKNCQFKSDSKAAFYLHNLVSQSGSMSALIDNAIIFGCIVRDKVGTGKSAVLLEDVGSSQIDEVKITNSEIYSFGGTDILLRKHPSYSGTRNTLISSLKNCKYGTLSYESNSGSIIDLDRGFFVNGPVSGTRGNPLLRGTGIPQMGKVVSAKISDTDNSPHVLGVASSYGSSVFCVTSGVSEAIVDASVAVAAGDFLSSKANSAFQKGTVGNGHCTAIALEPLSSGMAFIKVLLISPR